MYHCGCVDHFLSDNPYTDDSLCPPHGQHSSHCMARPNVSLLESLLEIPDHWCSLLEISDHWCSLLEITRVLCCFTVDTIMVFLSHTHTSFYEGEKIVLVIFSLVGFLFFDMVYMATAMNHAVQSELLVWLISSIRTLLLQNHYHNTDAAIKASQCASLGRILTLSLSIFYLSFSLYICIHIYCIYMYKFCALSHSHTHTHTHSLSLSHTHTLSNRIF